METLSKDQRIELRSFFGLTELGFFTNNELTVWQSLCPKCSGIMHTNCNTFEWKCMSCENQGRGLARFRQVLKEVNYRFNRPNLFKRLMPVIVLSDSPSKYELHKPNTQFRFKIENHGLERRVDIGKTIALFLDSIKLYKPDLGKYLVRCPECQKDCMLLDLHTNQVVCRHNYSGQKPIGIAGTDNIINWVQKMWKIGHEASVEDAAEVSLKKQVNSISEFQLQLLRSSNEELIHLFNIHTTKRKWNALMSRRRKDIAFELKRRNFDLSAILVNGIVSFEKEVFLNGGVVKLLA